MDKSEILKNDSEEGPFEESGECSDEVIFKFYDGKELYISQNFLQYTSLVLKGMIKEGIDGNGRTEILIKQESSDFLELLLSLHPGVQKPIDQSNVLSVVSLAEEYQIKPSIKKSKNTMIKWLSSEVDAAVDALCNSNRVKYARTCLIVLIKAISLGYDDVITHAVDVLARFPHEVFTGALKFSNYGRKPLFNIGTTKVDKKITVKKLGAKKPGVVKEEAGCTIGSVLSGLKPECPAEECKKLFESLSEEMKTRLFLQRLKVCDDGQMI